MKWLITGASGQLGRCLQETLNSKGIDFSKDFKKVNSQKISGEVQQSE